MDLKYFYQRLRAVSSEIQTDYIVIVSKSTPDGGKAGVYTEVTRQIGAQAVVEGRAQLASPQEEEEFRRQVKLQVEASAAEIADAQAAMYGPRSSVPQRLAK